jgi:hypothetical protein
MGRVGAQLRGGLGQQPRLRRERCALRVDPVGIAQPGAVQHDHAVARGQTTRERMGEVPRVAAGTVDQHQVGPFAHHHVMHRWPSIVRTARPRAAMSPRPALVAGGFQQGDAGEGDEREQGARGPASRRGPEIRGLFRRSRRCRRAWSGRPPTSSCRKADAHGCASGSAAAGGIVAGVVVQGHVDLGAIACAPSRSRRYSSFSVPLSYSRWLKM